MTPRAGGPSTWYDLFCRCVGPGGRCPHCDEPVGIVGLVDAGA